MKSTKNNMFPQLTKLSINCPKASEIKFPKKIKYLSCLALRDLRLSGLNWEDKVVWYIHDFFKNFLKFALLFLYLKDIQLIFETMR